MARVHQASFRERVLRAYQRRCAVCRLRHVELLEAAHIIPDKDPRGQPIVPNGLALCTLHHAAFDRHILGVTPHLVSSPSEGAVITTGRQAVMLALAAVPGGCLGAKRR